MYDAFLLSLPQNMPDTPSPMVYNSKISNEEAIDLAVSDQIANQTHCAQLTTT